MMRVNPLSYFPGNSMDFSQVVGILVSPDSIGASIFLIYTIEGTGYIFYSFRLSTLICSHDLKNVQLESTRHVSKIFVK